MPRVGLSSRTNAFPTNRAELRLCRGCRREFVVAMMVALLNEGFRCRDCWKKLLDEWCGA